MDKNSILIALSESPRTKFGKEDFALQSPPQQVFSAVWCVESEVNNGGFAQFFANDSTDTAPFLVEALHTIHAPQTAAICRRAIEIAFPAGLPASPEAIRAAAADFSEDILNELEAIDAQFMAYPHDLTELLFAFVVAHPEEFGPLPQAG